MAWTDVVVDGWHLGGMALRDRWIEATHCCRQHPLTRLSVYPPDSMDSMDIFSGLDGVSYQGLDKIHERDTIKKLAGIGLTRRPASRLFS